MPVWLCKECAGRNKGEKKVQKEEETNFPTHAGLGITLGALSGNPVLIAVGGAAGAMVDSKDKIADELGFQSSCEICGEEDKLESCYECGRRVCSDCRYILADRDEETGDYLPYRRDEESFDRGGWSKLTPIKRGSGEIDEGGIEDVVDLDSGRESSEGEQGNGLGWEGADFSTSEGLEGDFSLGEGLGKVGESGEGNGSGESSGSSTGGEADG